MTAKEVMKELESYGDETIKNIYLNHGIKEPLFGVRIQDMKKILKKIKKNHELSLELYSTGNYDAKYFAGLIADENKISKDDLMKWAKEASNSGISEYTVPWIASESKFGYELGLKWIDSNNEAIASSGWCTLAYMASLKPDNELDLKVYRNLLNRVEKEIHTSPNRVKYTMNGFVIAIGSYIKDLSNDAIKVAKNIGTVNVNMGDTSCKVPLATAYINKVISKGKLGNKRKKARC